MKDEAKVGVTIETLMNAVEGDPVMMKAGKKATMLQVALKLAKEQKEVA